MCVQFQVSASNADSSMNPARLRKYFDISALPDFILSESVCSWNNRLLICCVILRRVKYILHYYRIKINTYSDALKMSRNKLNLITQIAWNSFDAFNITANSERSIFYEYISSYEIKRMCTYPIRIPITRISYWWKLIYKLWHSLR